MAHPTVAAAQTSSSTTTTSHTITLPSGIVAGSLVVILWSATATGEILTWPAGWTGVVNEPFGSGGNRNAQVAYRLCDGTEGASIVGTTSGSTSATASALRIAGHRAATAPYVGTTATGNSSAPNPPSFNPGIGSRECLWLAFTSALQTVSTAPTNYTLEGNTGGRSWARRALTASSEDAGAFALSGSQQWIAGIVAVDAAPVFRDAVVAIALTSTMAVAAGVVAIRDAVVAIALSSTMTVAAGVATFRDAAVGIALQSTVAVAAQILEFRNASVAIALQSTMAISAGVLTFVNAAVSIALSITMSIGARVRTFLINPRTFFRVTGVRLDPKTDRVTLDGEDV